jgi:autotransporter-associated beta strand protein
MNMTFHRASNLSPLRTAAVACLLLLLLSLAPRLSAQTTYTFNTNIGSATGNWGTAGTWTNNSGAPGAGDTVVMQGGNSKNLGVNGNRTAANFIFTNAAGSGSVIGASSGVDSLLTISGVLTMDGTQALTFRNSGTSLLSLDINQLDLSGSGNLSFGSSTSQPINNLKIGTLNLNNTSTTGLFIFGDDGETATIDTVNLTEGRINLRNATSGSTTLEVGTLSGTGGSVRSANSVSGAGASGVLRITNTSGTATFGGLLLDGDPAAVLHVEKIGAGTQVLTGANTYTGRTLISGGVLQIGNGGTTGTLGVGAVTNNATLTFNRSNALTNSSVIAGSGQLVQAGVGTLTLSGSNSYTGGTAINAGALALGSAEAIGSAGVISFGGGALRYSASNTTDYSSRLSSAAAQAYAIDTAGQNVTFASALTSSGGSLSKIGTGTLTLSAANTYNGGTAVNGGTLLLSGGNNRLATDGSVSVSSGAVLNLGGNSQTVSGLNGTGSVTNSAGNLTVSANGSFGGVLSGAGGLVKTGSGTQVVSGINTYTGGTFINGGVLSVSDRTGFASRLLSFDGGVLDITSQFTTIMSSLNATTLNAGGGTIRIAEGVTQSWGTARISGTGALTKDGSGVLVFAANNTYQGGTVINGGTVSVDSVTRLNGNTGGLTFNGGTLLNTATTASTKLTTVNAGGGTFETTAGTTNTWNGVISGTGKVVKTGDGVLSLTGINNAFEGGLEINGGILQIGSDSRLGTAGGAVSFNGGTLRSVNNVGAANRTTTINAGGATFDVASGFTNTWGGNVSGAGGLTKSDVGTLILSGNNSYGGATTVGAGALMINGDSSSATGLLTVASGATLGGSGVIGGNTIINGALSPGNSPGLLTFAGDLTLNGTALFEIAGLTRGTLYDAVDVGGLLTYGGTLTLNFSSPLEGSFNLFDFGSTTGSFDSILLTGGYSGSLDNMGGQWTGNIGGVDLTFMDSTGVLNVVPEPSTYALLVLSGMALAAHVIRRRKRLKF